jgi:hypothetical protein
MKVTRMSPEAWTTKLSELRDADLAKFCLTVALAAGVDPGPADDDEGKVRLSHKGTGYERIMTPEEFKAMTIGEYIALCRFLAGDE